MSALGFALVVTSLAFVGLVVAAVPLLVQLLRTARTAEQTLGALEREVRPIASQLQALLQEHRDLAQQATRDLRQVEGLARRGEEVLSRVTALTGLLSSVGSVGRAVGLVQGLRKGAGVFMERLARR